MIRRTCLFVSCVFCLLVLSCLTYGYPYTFNEQGVLRNSTTNELINATHQFNITIYNSSDNKVLYSKAQNYEVVNGIYNLLWSDLRPLDFYESTYFRLKVGSSAQFPKIDFSAVPYAFMAEVARNVSCRDIEGAITNLCTLTPSGYDDRGLQANITALNNSINDLNNTLQRIDLLNLTNFNGRIISLNTSFSDAGITENISSLNNSVNDLNNSLWELWRNLNSNISSLNASVNFLNNSMLLRAVQNGTNVLFQDVNITSGLKVGGDINGSFKLSCDHIDGGTDTDYCADFSEVFSDAGLVGNITLLNSSVVSLNSTLNWINNTLQELRLGYISNITSLNRSVNDLNNSLKELILGVNSNVTALNRSINDLNNSKLDRALQNNTDVLLKNLNITSTTTTNIISGRLGIGTTADPAQSLTVQGGLNVSGNANISNYLFVNATNVGIGTKTPGRALQIVAVRSNEGLEIVDGTDSNNQRFLMGLIDGSGGYILLKDEAEVSQTLIRSYALGGVQGYFLAGNMGFGASDPGQKITVQGSANISVALNISNTTFINGTGISIGRKDYPTAAGLDIYKDETARNGSVIGLIVNVTNRGSLDKFSKTYGLNILASNAGTATSGELITGQFLAIGGANTHNHIAIVANASGTGTGTSIGILGTATNGGTTTNTWAGYFDEGDVFVKHELTIQNTTPNQPLTVGGSSYFNESMNITLTAYVNGKTGLNIYATNPNNVAGKLFGIRSYVRNTNINTASNGVIAGLFNASQYAVITSSYATAVFAEAKGNVGNIALIANASVGTGNNFAILASGAGIRADQIRAATGATDYVCVDIDGDFSRGDSCTTFEGVAAAKDTLGLKESEFKVLKTYAEYYPDHSDVVSNYFYTVQFFLNGAEVEGTIKVPNNMEETQIPYYLKSNIEIMQGKTLPRLEVTNKFANKIWDGNTIKYNGIIDTT